MLAENQAQHDTYIMLPILLPRIRLRVLLKQHHNTEGKFNRDDIIFNCEGKGFEYSECPLRNREERVPYRTRNPPRQDQSQNSNPNHQEGMVDRKGIWNELLEGELQSTIFGVCGSQY